MECEVCGHESEDAFEVVRHVGRHTFDTFECAIYAMAPRCARCGVRVVGHGVKDHDHSFCCTHCAEAGPRKEGNPGGEGGKASDAGESNHTDDDDDDDDDDDEAADDHDDDSDDDDDDDASDDEEEEEEEEEGEQKLDKLGERISQARQSSDDLLSDPEDEVDQDDKDQDDKDKDED